MLTFPPLIQGHINSGCPDTAINMFNEILHQGIMPDRLTYNTLILACVESEKLDVAMQLFAEMKVILAFEVQV
jgi:pentatricopeptide repeat protein